jgi:hypothetical protein
MLGKIRIGLRDFLINVFRCTSGQECATCHNVIQCGDYFTQIDKFKYCTDCRPVRAVIAPNNLRTDLVKNERLNDKHRKTNEAERETLRQKEIAEFKALSAKHVTPQAPTPEREPTTEPINLANGDDRENVCVFRIDRFTRAQIINMDTARIPTIEQQKHA